MTEKKYRIDWFQDNIYQVRINEEDWGYGLEDSKVLFQGTLPEVSAWIELTERGYSL